jgi:hypothetical protein
MLAKCAILSPYLLLMPNARMPPQRPQIVPGHDRLVRHPGAQRPIRVHPATGECVPRAARDPQVVHHRGIPRADRPGAAAALPGATQRLAVGREGVQRRDRHHRRRRRERESRFARSLGHGPAQRDDERAGRAEAGGEHLSAGLTRESGVWHQLHNVKIGKYCRACHCTVNLFTLEHRTPFFAESLEGFNPILGREQCVVRSALKVEA